MEPSHISQVTDKMTPKLSNLESNIYGDYLDYLVLRYLSVYLTRSYWVSEMVSVLLLPVLFYQNVYAINLRIEY